MSTAPLPPTIKGWCPDAAHPMETGDGLLVRLRVTGGELSADLCAAIGKLARDHGNGLIDLSQRGNLQLRGVSTETLPALTHALRDLGLLEHDGLRHVIGSPLAGLDPTACIDGQALVRDLEIRLAASPGLQSLPGKFCFLVDDGGRFGLDSVAADVRLTEYQGRVSVAIGARDGAAFPVALVEASKVADAAIALAYAFLRLSPQSSARRMDQLVDAIGADAIAQAAGFVPHFQMPAMPTRITDAQDVIGIHDGFIGTAAPFGRFDAAQMDELATLAPHGLRLTPWRSILLPHAKADVLAPLERAGLIVSPDDPRLAIVACPGKPACGSAHIDTRQAAQELAPFARQWRAKGISLHLSGCEKGCACATPTPITLVGRDGAYDLTFNGRADAVPHMRGLSLPHAIEAIRDAAGWKAAS